MNRSGEPVALAEARRCCPALTLRKATWEGALLVDFGQGAAFHDAALMLDGAPYSHREICPWPRHQPI